MTKQEIVRAMEKLLEEDAKRPAEEQFRDLIDAGIIDEKGRVIIGGNYHIDTRRNGSPGVAHSRKAGRNGKPAPEKARSRGGVAKAKRKA